MNAGAWADSPKARKAGFCGHATRVVRLSMREYEGNLRRAHSHPAHGALGVGHAREKSLARPFA